MHGASLDPQKAPNPHICKTLTMSPQPIARPADHMAPKAWGTKQTTALLGTEACKGCSPGDGRGVALVGVLHLAAAGQGLGLAGLGGRRRLHVPVTSAGVEEAQLQPAARHPASTPPVTLMLIINSGGNWHGGPNRAAMSPQGV